MKAKFSYLLSLISVISFLNLNRNIEKKTFEIPIFYVHIIRENVFMPTVYFLLKAERDNVQYLNHTYILIFLVIHTIET